MDPILQTGIGVAVSILLFLVAYRQTVGAKKERIRSASFSLRRSLLRRVVLENYDPSPRDLERLIESKARESRLTPEDLLSAEELVTDVYAEVFESELIDPQRRSSIEGRLTAAFQALRPQVVRLDQLLEAGRRAETVSRMLVPLAAVATLLGIIVSLFPQLREGSLLSSQSLQLAIAVAGVSVGLIAAFLVVRRQRERVSGSSPLAARAEGVKFESAVARELSRAKADFQVGIRSHSGEADFLLRLGNKRIAVEAKAWKGRVPSVVVTAAARRLSRLIGDRTVDAGLIVVPEDARPPEGTLEDARVEVVTLSELRRRLPSR